MSNVLLVCLSFTKPNKQTKNLHTHTKIVFIPSTWTKRNIIIIIRMIIMIMMTLKQMVKWRNQKKTTKIDRFFVIFGLVWLILAVFLLLPVFFCWFDFVWESFPLKKKKITGKISFHLTLSNHNHNSNYPIWTIWFRERKKIATFYIFQIPLSSPPPHYHPTTTTYLLWW